MDSYSFPAQTSHFLDAELKLPKRTKSAKALIAVRFLKKEK
jgi:hypothetical protein